MANATTFLGKDLPRDPGLTLTEAVYLAICREIHGGRWRPGDRLPSVAMLSRESGLSGTTIQRAFEQLAQEGYVEQRYRSGTYLKEILAKPQPPGAVVGIPILVREVAGQLEPAPYAQLKLHDIIREAGRRNLLTEVVSVPAEVRWEDLVTPGKVFSSRVVGVIMPETFGCWSPLRLPENRLPAVVIGDYDRESSPCVASDLRRGFFRLAKRVTARGHRRVVFFGSGDYSELKNRDALDGVVRALHDAGARVDAKAQAAADRVPERDHKALAAWCRAWPGVTALVFLSLDRAQAFVRVAKQLGRRVPKDVSVVTGGASGEMDPEEPGPQFTRLRHCRELIMKTGFDVLMEQIETRQCPHGLITVQPEIIEGDSLADPPAADE